MLNTVVTAILGVISWCW